MAAEPRGGGSGRRGGCGGRGGGGAVVDGGRSSWDGDERGRGDRRRMGAADDEDGLDRAGLTDRLGVCADGDGDRSGRRIRISRVDGDGRDRSTKVDGDGIDEDGHGSVARPSFE